MVALPLDGSSKNMVVQWPQAPRLKESLIRAAGMVLKHRKALMQIVKKPDLSDNIQPPLVVAAPLMFADGGTGAASLVLKDASTDTGKAVLQHLNRELKKLSQQLGAETSAAPTSPKDETAEPHTDPHAQTQPLQLVTHLLATALATPRFDAACAAVATELATQFHCERVSIGIRSGDNTELAGLSHNAEVKTRHDFSRSLVAVMDESIDQQHTLRYPEPEGQSLITLAAGKFSAQHGQHELCVLPLIFEQQCIGSIVLENPKGRAFSSDTCEVLEHISSFLAPVLDMKARTSQPWWKRLRQSPARLAHWLRKKDNAMAKLLMVTGVLAMVALSLPLATFRISAPAHVEGLVQRTLTSPENSYIKDVLVRPGDSVEKGQTLVTLENKELELREQELHSKLEQLEAKYGSALASRDRTQLAVIAGEMEETRANLKLVRQQLSRSTIVSPFAGQIIEGDLTQSLGAPVKRGDVLMVLAPLGEYRVIFDVRDSDISELDLNQHAELALTSDPSQRYPLEIRRISPMAKVKDGQNVFEVEARLPDSSAQTRLRPGLEGLVKVEVEKRSPLWITLRGVLNWLDFQLWRWFGLS